MTTYKWREVKAPLAIMEGTLIIKSSTEGV